MRAVICQVAGALGDWELYGEDGLVCDVGARTRKECMTRMLQVVNNAIDARDPLEQGEWGIYLETMEVVSKSDEARIVAATVVATGLTPIFKWEMKAKPKRRRR